MNGCLLLLSRAAALAPEKLSAGGCGAAAETMQAMAAAATNHRGSCLSIRSWLLEYLD